MGLFKKNKKTALEEYSCPLEGCAFSAYDSTSLQRHIEWKHPELAESPQASEKAD
jgi:hypothetical protein